jgi:hypothetical protein
MQSRRMVSQSLGDDELCLLNCRSLKGTRLSPRLRTEAVLHRAACYKALQQVQRERHVAHHRRLVAQQAVAWQVELQGLGGDRVEASERPVLTAKSRLNLLHQVQCALVLAAHQIALRGDFEAGRAGPGIPADQPRAVDVEREQYAYRKLPEAWIALQRPDCIS